MIKYASLVLFIGALIFFPSSVSAQFQNPFCGWGGVQCPPTPVPVPTPGTTPNSTPTPSPACSCSVCTQWVCEAPAPTPTPTPAPIPTPTTSNPPQPGPVGSGPGCFGGIATTFTPIIDIGGFGTAVESDMLGGQGPQGETGVAPTKTGVDNYFVGVSGHGRSIWVPRHTDTRGTWFPSEAAINLAISKVNGARYFELYPAGPTTCAFYESPVGWPAPGGNYIRVGTSGGSNIGTQNMGSGLPIYARQGTDPAMIQFVVVRTTGGIQ